jgi:MurNAc alpha-1-phosphate uridylyltransferase
MKAMILAAGEGRRMRPLTDVTPKPLLEVAGKPLIEHHIARLGAAGFIEIVVNVSHLGQHLVDFLGDGSQWQVAISISSEQTPLETAGGIIQALPHLGDAPFLLVNGDVFTYYPFDQLRKTVPGERGAHIVLVPNPAHRSEGDFLLSDRRFKDLPVAADSSGATQDVAPKQTSLPEANLSVERHRVSALTRSSTSSVNGCSATYSGIGVYDPGLFADCAPGRHPLKSLLDEAIARASLSGELYQGVWEDVGTPERLNALNQRFPSDSANQ